MHRNQNSFESTPQTVHSSNLSSVMEPNPVIRRLDEHFADLEQGNDAMQQLMEEGVYVPNERTPDKMTSADVASQAGSERDAVQHESDKEDKSVKHVLMQAEEKEDAGSGHGDKIDQQAAAEEVRIDGAKDGGALVRRRSKSREHSRKISDSDAASIIQRNWVNQNYKKKNSKKHADVDKDNVSIKSFRSLERRGEVVDLNLPEDQLLYAHLTRASYVFESPMEKFLQSTSEDVKITAANEDLDLKEPWIPPSIEFAKNNAGRVHPRMLTQGHGQYPILGTSTGRHCVYKGWGEQCDLFHEGSFSSFGVYGPGITNYFKFIKFCFWTFVSLSVLYMPAFLFAVNGDGGLNELAATTLGNVVPYNHTDYTYVPECPRSALLLCEIKMENVGLMWELLDLLACVVVLVGFVWLRFFEKAETAHLNRCGVSPADYTVLVSNLPPSCTEADLRVYFAVLMNEAVSDIVFIYDDEDDIETFKRRGALVKKRYHLTQV